MWQLGPAVAGGAAGGQPALLPTFVMWDRDGAGKQEKSLCPWLCLLIPWSGGAEGQGGERTCQR